MRYMFISMRPRDHPGCYIGLEHVFRIFLRVFERESPRASSERRILRARDVVDAKQDSETWNGTTVSSVENATEMLVIRLFLTAILTPLLLTG